MPGPSCRQTNNTCGGASPWSPQLKRHGRSPVKRSKGQGKSKASPSDLRAGQDTNKPGIAGLVAYPIINIALLRAIDWK